MKCWTLLRYGLVIECFCGGMYSEMVEGLVTAERPSECKGLAEA